MSHPSFKLAIIGFGTVGEGVYRTIEKKSEKLVTLLGRSLEIPYVIVKNTDKEREVGEKTLVTNEFDTVINDRSLDVVIEATPDAETGLPYVKQLLQEGISVVSANKELIATYGDELYEIASDHGCHLLFEAAVAGGIPLLNTLRHTLKTNTIDRLEGIVNGTSNFILTKMRQEGAPFSQALSEAQEKGFAEAVPDKDVDGWDAYFKTNILSQWIYGRSPVWNDQAPIGIRHIHVDDLVLAHQLNGKIKHIAKLRKHGDRVDGSVKPSFVLHDHPLYSVEAENNGIHIQGSIVGSVMLQGPGAGKYPTASAIIEDVVNLLSGKHETVEHEGIEFVEHGFVENDGKSEEERSLWFVTGGRKLEKCLNYVDAELLHSLVRENQKVATIVHEHEDKMKELQVLAKGTIQVYPILGDKGDILSTHLEVLNKNTVSF
ncbi:homoserine dehydrogenase [Evansella halocellulosilytica]|uniref:homoserine dehydrogenase n=1 Tax=Evansella halocellulosilytica TaxID=2011013 RepID=UPI000BB94A6F|nr:homoserine dehydrogenase [Evansella halocellulosilytica]